MASLYTFPLSSFARDEYNFLQNMGDQPREVWREIQGNYKIRGTGAPHPKSARGVTLLVIC